MDLVLVLVMEPVLDIPSAVVILPVTVLATPAILPDPMATTTQDKVLLPVHTRRPMSLAVHLTAMDLLNQRLVLIGEASPLKPMVTETPDQ